MKLYYQGKEWTDIQYKECTLDYIATLLNEHKILIRNNKWNIGSISNIIDKIPIEERKPYGLITDDDIEEEFVDDNDDDSIEEEFDENEDEVYDEDEVYEEEFNDNIIEENVDITIPKINNSVIEVRPTIQTVISKKTDSIIENQDDDFEQLLNSHENVSVTSKKSNNSKKYLNRKAEKLKSIFNNMLSLIVDCDSSDESD